VAIANASPGSAILTLAPLASGEDGIAVNDLAPGSGLPAAVKVRGGIFSNSKINVTAGALANTWMPPTGSTARSYIIARGTCTGTVLVNASGDKICNYGATSDGRGTDPGSPVSHPASYDAPPAPAGAAVISSCAPGDKYQSVAPITPGGSVVLTSAATLNGLTGCSKSIVWFKPGTYYFNFQDHALNASNDDLWDVNNKFVFAGTPSTGSVLTATPSASTWPDACTPPVPLGGPSGTGAEFVFAGDSRMQVTHTGSPGGQVTICGSNVPDGPPIAVYGLKTAVGSIPAENGCIVNSASRCPVIYTDLSPNTTLTIQGTTYTPNAWIYVTLNNSTNQIFRWGLITYRLSIDTTGSPDVTQNLIDVPDEALIPVPSPKIVYLKVYVCAGAGTCSSSGTVSLTAKVQLNLDGTVTVLSWSKQN
jgi:hypothetical protein